MIKTRIIRKKNMLCPDEKKYKKIGTLKLAKIEDNELMISITEKGNVAFLQNITYEMNPAEAPSRARGRRVPGQGERGPGDKTLLVGLFFVRCSNPVSSI